MSAWSAEQRRLLGALGVTVFARVGDAAAVRVAEPVATRASAGEASFARLAAAIEHAAGGRNLADLLLDLPRLHASAAAKRALWPTLRALRRRT